MEPLSSHSQRLLAISNIVQSERPLEEVLGDLARVAAELLSASTCVISTVDSECLPATRAAHPPDAVPPPGEAPLLAVPVVVAGGAAGVLEVFSGDPSQAGEEERALATFAAQQAGCAIARTAMARQHERLRAEADDLKRQLETRKLVERAKGILQLRHALSEEEAYLRLRNESRRQRRPMRELAEAIIVSEDVARKAAAAQSRSYTEERPA